jgi:HTH-type transcriptional regulator, competence development regulator
VDPGDPEPTVNHFGNYIRARRMALSVSLRSLAETLEIDFSYLSKLETGREAPPSEGTIGRIAYALDVDEELLLALAGKVPAEVRARASTDPSFAYLLGQLPSLDGDRLQKIFAAAGWKVPDFDFGTDDTEQVVGSGGQSPG